MSIERKAFEEWAIKFGFKIEVSGATHPELYYFHRDTCLAWEGFKAAWELQESTKLESLDYEATKEHPVECREAFEKWHNEEYGFVPSYGETCYESEDSDALFDAFRAAWNTRPEAATTQIEDEEGK